MKKTKPVFNNFHGDRNRKYRSNSKEVYAENKGFYDNPTEFAEEYFNHDDIDNFSRELLTKSRKKYEEPEDYDME